MGSTVLSIGKKAAIAGTAVTSTLVVSLAFAVPFGVLFASVACAGRVMSSLLSHRPHRAPQPPQEEGFDEDEAEGEGGDVSNLISCYESAVEDQLWYAENKAASVTADYEVVFFFFPFL